MRKVSDTADQFTFDNIAAGQVTVSVELENANSEKQEVSVHSGEEIVVNFGIGSSR